MFIPLSLSLLISSFDVTSPQASLVTVVAPNERHLAHKRDPSAVESSALSPKVVDECEVRTMFVLWMLHFDLTHMLSQDFVARIR